MDMHKNNIELKWKEIGSGHNAIHYSDVGEGKVACRFIVSEKQWCIFAMSTKSNEYLIRWADELKDAKRQAKATFIAVRLGKGRNVNEMKMATSIMFYEIAFGSVNRAGLSKLRNLPKPS